jgi:hypothetical protein
MSVTHLQKWDVTAIEIALDLETPRFTDTSRLPISGPAEPRICLVAGFALNSHLKRIAAAVDRSVPPRPPAGLRITPLVTRSALAPTAAPVTVQPMLALLRLQSKLLRAIEPGLAHDIGLTSIRTRRDMDEAAARFTNGFILRKALPTFEPPFPIADFEAVELRAVGLTIYRLGRAAAPASIIAHWAYPPDSGSVHSRGGP